MRVDIIAKILEAAGAGTREESIFAHHMSDTCKKGVLIKLPLTGIPYDHNLPGYFNSRFQIIVRASKHAEGEALCETVIKALKSHRIREYEEIGKPGVIAMKLNYCLPEHLPIRFPRLEGSGIEWSINFLVSYVIPT